MLAWSEHITKFKFKAYAWKHEQLINQIDNHYQHHYFIITIIITIIIIIITIIIMILVFLVFFIVSVILLYKDLRNLEQKTNLTRKQTWINDPRTCWTI